MSLYLPYFASNSCLDLDAFLCCYLGFVVLATMPLFIQSTSTSTRFLENNDTYFCKTCRIDKSRDHEMQHVAFNI